MAKDLAEEQCCVAQRCGTQATKEHWGQIICDLELKIFSTIERERESAYKVLSSFMLLVTSCIPLWIHLYQYRELFSSCCFSFSLLQNLSQVFTSHICCVLCPHCPLTLQCCCHAGQSMLKSDPETVRHPGCQGLKGLRRHG